MQIDTTWLIAVLSLIVVGIHPAGAAPVTTRPQYDVQATVSLDPAVVHGTVTVLFTNHSARILRDVAVMLFPNRFSAENEITDLARPMIHPEEEFDAGGMTLLDVFDDGHASTYAAEPAAVAGTVVRVAIAPLAAGESRRLQMRFRTEVPHRFGGFGEFERQLTLIGGWHPYLATLGDDGDWKFNEPPPMADFRVTVDPSTAMQIVCNGHFGAGERPLHAFVPAVPYLSLIASPRLLKATRRVGETTVTLLVRPKRFSHRVVAGLDEPGLIMQAVEHILSERPAGIDPLPANLLLIEAPLRLHLIEPGEGMVVFSDRLYQALGPLRDFHEAHLAQGVYQELLRGVVGARESARDYGWVAEGLSDELAGRYMDARQPERRLLREWLNMFDFLAAVDRFEKVPKIPFVTSYFEQLPTADPAGDRILTFNHPRPPGRVILGKMRDLVGEAEYRAMFDACLPWPIPLRQCAAEHFPGRGIADFIEQWNAPYPELNYRIASVDFNRPDGERYRTTVEVRREASRPITEPVTIRLRTVGGADVDLKWNSRGEVALISETTDRRVYQAHIDPDEKLIETRRDDNAWLPRFEFLIDSADIEVSSTEFGFGASGVARIHQDYRRDIALTAFYTNRGLGLAIGPRFHFGTPIDPTLYRHNLYLFYSRVALDRDFDDPARPDIFTSGDTAGIGFRYDYTDVFYDQNPSVQRRFRIHGDWHDGALGSDYNFASWGYEASLIVPLLTRRTLLGMQVVNGFSRAAGGSEVPNQALYSLGGARSIRGIGFGDQLGRNLLVLRSEIRQSIYPELNWNLQDILILRRTQVRFFAETGNVDNSARHIYDPRDWAVGIGVGLGLVYDAAGFFPAIAYLEIATRVDERDDLGDIQILFGTKQPF